MPPEHQCDKWCDPAESKWRDRILIYRDGVPIWEGKSIHPDDPIPEIGGTE